MSANGLSYQILQLKSALIVATTMTTIVVVYFNSENKGCENNGRHCTMTTAFHYKILTDNKLLLGFNTCGFFV